MVVPSIPQLHEGLLGPHVTETDLDSGSFNGSLVCAANDKPGALSQFHPSIKFDEPIYALRVVAKSVPSGSVVWDASYSLEGAKELPAKAHALGGAQMDWKKICTPAGDVENYKIDINADGGTSGTFSSSVSFTSNNANSVKLSEFLFPTRPTIARPPENPPIIPINPTDLNPYKYM